MKKTKVSRSRWTYRVGVLGVLEHVRVQKLDNLSRSKKKDVMGVKRKSAVCVCVRVCTADNNSLTHWKRPNLAI